jgi:hypothetical protein
MAALHGQAVNYIVFRVVAPVVRTASPP